jgi:hypothetical protein
MAKTFEENLGQAQLDALNKRVEELSQDQPVHIAELLAVIEVSMIEALRILAGYTYEMQDKIMRAMTGAVPDLGQPTATQFADSFEMGYMVDKQARMVSLLEDKQEATDGDDSGDVG